MLPSTKLTADWINEYCKNYDYFWAIGLIKETLALWKKPHNFLLLCSDAQEFCSVYLNRKEN